MPRTSWAGSAGVVFETREFSLYDGPGIRTTVFMKGCPLRCAWCHNPEGLSPYPEVLYSERNCTHCGACAEVCPLPSGTYPEYSDIRTCKRCGRCASSCPSRARRMCGRRILASELAAELLETKDFFATGALEGNGSKASEPAFSASDPFERIPGGVTFSGGEPLMQAEFVAEVARLLRFEGVHTAVETCGYAPLGKYRTVVFSVDLVYQDLKHPDDATHRKYTGVSNRPILDNVEWLKGSGKPWVARIPLIPGVNDSADDLAAFAGILAGPSGLARLELLPYHASSGGKYALLGKEPPMVFEEREYGDDVLRPFDRLVESGVGVRLL